MARILSDRCGTRGCAQDSVTPVGQYEFLWMTFGMVNSGATLVQELKKEEIAEETEERGVSSYIDDNDS